jgi:hypothetical protein
MKNVVKFYDRLEYFMAIWQSGIVNGQLVYFSILVCLDPEKSGNHAPPYNFKRLLL